MSQTDPVPALIECTEQWQKQTSQEAISGQGDKCKKRSQLRMPLECRGEHLTLEGDQKLDQRGEESGDHGQEGKPFWFLVARVSEKFYRDVVSHKALGLSVDQIMKGLVNQNKDLGSQSTLSRGVT